MRRICVFVPVTTLTGTPAVETTPDAHPPRTAEAAVGARADRAILLRVRDKKASTAAAPPRVPDSLRQRRLARALLAVDSASPRV